MLTGFKNRAVQQKVGVEKQEMDKKHRFMLDLLGEAIKESIEEGNARVYIESDPFRVEYKLPLNYSINHLKRDFEAKALVPLESKVLGGEIISHTFKVTTLMNEIVELLYRPISRPRM